MPLLLHFINYIASGGESYSSSHELAFNLPPWFITWPRPPTQCIQHHARFANALEIEGFIVTDGNTSERFFFKLSPVLISILAREKSNATIFHLSRAAWSFPFFLLILLLHRQGPVEKKNIRKRKTDVSTGVSIAWANKLNTLIVCEREVIWKERHTASR